MKDELNLQDTEVNDPLGLVCILPENVRPERRAEIRAVFASRTRFTLQPDGVELEFSPSEENARALLDFILFERLCCKTFSYELSFAQPHTAVTLRLRAVAAQVEILQALYSSLTATEATDE